MLWVLSRALARLTDFKQDSRHELDTFDAGAGLRVRSRRDATGGIESSLLQEQPAPSVSNQASEPEEFSLQKRHRVSLGCARLDDFKAEPRGFPL